MREPTWILISVLIAEHEAIIAEHGGLPGIRDMNLLESSCNAPKQLYYYSDPKPPLEHLAARYAYSIARNHPFRDGNKRISLQACEIFLALNDLSLEATQEEKYFTFLDLTVNTISEEKLIKWKKENRK